MAVQNLDHSILQMAPSWRPSTRNTNDILAGERPMIPLCTPRERRTSSAIADLDSAIGLPRKPHKAASVGAVVVAFGVEGQHAGKTPDAVRDGVLLGEYGVVDVFFGTLIFGG